MPKRISIDEFKSHKTSDTIFILGSGFSINKVSPEYWDIISGYNSIGFNWFCKHDFEPTFFFIREQANTASRRSKEGKETIDKFRKRVVRYENTVGVICDVSNHSKNAYKYHKDPKLTMPCLVLKDDKSKKYRNIKNMDRDPSVKGLIHGTCTIYNILHLVKYLNYKTIAFVGVDLYDSRYFWLPPKVARHTVVQKGQKAISTHAVASKTVGVVRRFNKKFDVDMFVTNPKSRLTKAIRYKSIGEFA